MATFGLKELEEEILTIPDCKGPMIIGSKGNTIRKIREQSGAKIIIDLKQSKHYAKIYGTKSQRSAAKSLIKKLLQSTNQLRHGLVLPALKKIEFTTMDKFDDCLEMISDQLSKADPTNLNRKEIRLNIFIGQELFIKSGIVKQDRIIDSYDWCGFKRGHGGVSTSFQHNSLQIINNMEIIKKKFGLKARNEDENIENDKRSISIYYNDQRAKRGKLKLHWFEEEGTNMPDLRFLLKSQYDVPIDDDLKELVINIQRNKPLVLRDGLWFRMDDFKDNKLYDDFVFSVVATRQEKEKGEQIAVEEYISVKSLDWRAVENIDKKPSLQFDDEEVHKTVKNTLDFAKKIAKFTKIN
ncbi:8887_t:CDS:2 [Diversispora eburnea]|uniref:8887_t:CDS:1 n=1 Tax=Diversispora eburnea TaxID=1213867 RepID=A0A9N8V5G6_9GLOM|nr:8887_t:CDS:2 [Diversispora eburnea]